MDKKEALQILDNILAELKTKDYSWFSARVGSVDAYEVKGDSAKTYQVEVEIKWDGKRNQAVRVFATIDDGGWSAFIPLSRDLIIPPA